jgi:death on curing protein
LEYVDLVDYLLIAEAVPGVPAESTAGLALDSPTRHCTPRQRAFEGVELYPDVFDKAAVLCARLARNHPLPDGNKRVAYLAMLEFLARNHISWIPPSVDETVATVEGVAAGNIQNESSQTGREPCRLSDTSRP